MRGNLFYLFSVPFLFELKCQKHIKKKKKISKKDEKKKNGESEKINHKNHNTQGYPTPFPPPLHPFPIGGFRAQHNQKGGR